MGHIHRPLLVCFIALSLRLCCHCFDTSSSEDCGRCVKDFKRTGGCSVLRKQKDFDTTLVKPDCGTCGMKVLKACIHDAMEEDTFFESLWESAAYVAKGASPLGACTSTEGDAGSESCPAAADQLPDVTLLDCSAGTVTPKTLLGPLRNDFHATYWQRRPVFIKRRDQAGWVCYGTFDEIFNTDFLEWFPHVLELIDRNKGMNLVNLGDGDGNINNKYPNAFIAYLAGVSVMYRRLDQVWPHAAHFCRDLTKALPAVLPQGVAPYMNLYITPPGHNQPFGLHNDADDVLIFQLSGKKTWRVQYNRSLVFNSMDKLGAEQREHPALHAVLQPGDLLYVPRLHRHEAFTDGTSHSASISLTFPCNSQKARSDGKMSLKGQKMLLKSHPLPRGMRTGPFNLRSQLAVREGRCAGCDDAKLMKDVRATLKTNVARGEQRKRSLSNRVLNSIVTALRDARLRAEQVQCSSLQTQSMYGSDNFEKLAIAWVLDWLGYGELIPSY